MASTSRDYPAIAAQVSAEGTPEARMQAVADALWAAFRDKGISWVGFYLDRPGEPDDRRLVLGPFRDKPACTPIGLHGVCGQALQFRQTRIVPDVTALGEDYIACDPQDRSEIVVPLVAADDADGQPLRQIVVELEAGDLPDDKTGRQLAHARRGIGQQVNDVSQFARIVRR